MEERNSNSLYYSLNITNDPFDGSKSISLCAIKKSFTTLRLSPVCGIYSYANDYRWGFIFGFRNIGGQDFIFFQFYKKEITINSRDKIYFLFENGERIVIEIINNPTLYCKDDLGLRYEAKERMMHEDLELFKKEKFHLWKIEKKSGTTLIGGNEGVYEYSRKSELQTTIKQYAESYLEEVIRNVENYKPTNKNSIQSEDQSLNSDDKCYVYLMIDSTNNFYKIGISNKPKFREKTLQSEKPTIEILLKKEFPNRKIAGIFEKSLHVAYNEKRIRGEWFSLSEQDIYELNSIFKEA